MPRFFVTNQQICENTITITGEDAGHIARVLRAKPGDTLTCCDEAGMVYTAEMIEVDSTAVRASILLAQPSDVEPPVQMILYQGLPKGDKMEWILQKCVELGVYRVVPVETERSVVRLAQKEEKKLTRWQKIAEAAAKQSGRAIIPQVGPRVLSFAEAIAEMRELSGAVMAYEEEKERGIKAMMSAFSGKSLGILIGPEGGFSSEEVLLAQEAGIQTITLGRRILRTETAGMVVLALLLHELEG